MSGTVLDTIEEGARMVPGALVVYLGSDLFAQFMKEEYPFVKSGAQTKFTFYCGHIRIIHDLNIIPPDSMEFLAVPEGIDEVI